MLICVSVEPSGRVIVRYLCSITFHPEGIPSSPVGQDTPATLLNVPVEDTSFNQ